VFDVSKMQAILGHCANWEGVSKETDLLGLTDEPQQYQLGCRDPIGFDVVLETLLPVDLV